MIRRHPHIAQITLKPATVGSVTGIVTKDIDKPAEVFDIRGRFENKSGNDRDYNAKFYATTNPKFELIDNDNAQLVHKGRTYNIVRLVPMQTHTELWLIS